MKLPGQNTGHAFWKKEYNVIVAQGKHLKNIIDSLTLGSNAILVEGTMLAMERATFGVILAKWRIVSLLWHSAATHLNICSQII